MGPGASPLRATEVRVRLLIDEVSGVLMAERSKEA